MTKDSKLLPADKVALGPGGKLRCPSEGCKKLRMRNAAGIVMKVCEKHLA